MQIRDIRNVGISAHIDSGKTTLAERILFYTGRIHRIQEVHDGGATTDNDPLEAAHGISIHAAATSLSWRDHHINLIDTPGHMDFTVEVERALRVLDGAVLLLCAVSGVQAQTYTVVRQMDRYDVPRIAFINKCDRPGANPAAVVAEMSARLGLNAALIQIPLFDGDRFDGVLDLIDMVALRFEGEHGERVASHVIPDALLSDATAAREALLDAVSLFDDALTEDIIEGRPVRREAIHAAIRSGVLSRQFVPVLMGSAYKNQGVQPLLDAVLRYLPAPHEISHSAFDAEGAVVPLSGGPEAEEMVSIVFKVQEDRYGHLSWVRVYQGAISTGDHVLDVRQGKRLRVGRLVRLNAGLVEPIDAVQAGDIAALYGVELASGDTLTSQAQLTMAGMHIPEPVVEVAVTLEKGKTEKLSAALRRLTREDPTLRVRTDTETGELRLRGMGELHLQIVAERLAAENNLEIGLGAPEVAQRFAIQKRAVFNHLFSRQTGGPGAYARVIGTIEPIDGLDNEFVWEVVGGAIPSQFRDAVRKGFITALAEGLDAPAVGVRVIVTDGAAHSKDSSDRAFQVAAGRALKEVFPLAMPVTLEPLMRVEVEANVDNQGAVLRTLLTRRATVLDVTQRAQTAVVVAEVPLKKMFGFSSALQSATAGTGGFTMDFDRFAPVTPE